MRLLVVEDNPGLATVLERGLAEEGYAVDVARTTARAEELLSENDYDTVLLDLWLPGADGLDLLQSIRCAGSWVPVLILTARGSLDDRVRGLDFGADDYMTKPFAFPELAARLRAMVRRAPSPRPPVLEAGDLTLDPATRHVARNGEPIRLTLREFSLLEYLMRHSGKVVARAQIIEHVWDFAYDRDFNVLEVYVRYLREKVDRPFGRQSIQTVRGVGYKVEDDRAGTHSD